MQTERLRRGEQFIIIKQTERTNSENLEDALNSAPSVFSRLALRYHQSPL